MKTDDKAWLMERIEKLVKDPKKANFGIDRSRCDLEIIIDVAEEDRAVFTEAVLTQLQSEIATRTRVLAPTVYLKGNEPEWLAKGHYIT